MLFDAFLGRRDFGHGSLNFRFLSLECVVDNLLVIHLAYPLVQFVWRLNGKMGKMLPGPSRVRSLLHLPDPAQ